MARGGWPPPATPSHPSDENRKNNVLRIKKTIEKKTWHTLKRTIILFSTAQIFIPQRSAILRKNCLCKHFLQNIVLWSNKRTWFVTQIHVLTKKDIHSRGLQWSFIRYKYLYPRVPPFWERIAYVSIFLQNIVLWSNKRTWFVTQITF